MNQSPSNLLYRSVRLSNGFLKRKNPSLRVLSRNTIRNLSLLNGSSGRDDYDSDCLALHQINPITFFSEDESMTRDAARSWANSQLKPLVREMDDEERINPSILQQLFDNGFMAMVCCSHHLLTQFSSLINSCLFSIKLQEIPEQYGGCAMNFTSACLVIEEISRVDPSIAIVVDIHNT